MQMRFSFKNRSFEVNLSNPHDITLPVLFNSLDNVNAWYCPPPEAFPQMFGDFTIAVNKGAAVNSFGVRLYPHGNGTHTETWAHIAATAHPIRSVVSVVQTMAKLVSIMPQKADNGDRLIDAEAIEAELSDADKGIEALVLRTWPNDDLKKQVNYSGANPPYLTAAAAQVLREKGIKHLLIDLPSVDREEDGGKVAAHKAFWGLDGADTEGGRSEATITELIWVPNTLKDGYYWLALSVPAFDLDAAPSRAVLYDLIEA